MGRRVERGLSICRIARQLGHAQDEAGAMGVLLDLCDSQITYRARYLTAPMRDPVLDLLLLDPDNPRSLAFQLQTINDHIDALPRLGEGQMPEPPQREARALLAPLLSLTIAEVDEALLQDIETRLLSLSEAITTRFFLQYEKTQTADRDNLLA